MSETGGCDHHSGYQGVAPGTWWPSARRDDLASQDASEIPDPDSPSKTLLQYWVMLVVARPRYCLHCGVSFGPSTLNTSIALGTRQGSCEPYLRNVVEALSNARSLGNVSQRATLKCICGSLKATSLWTRGA